MKLLCLIIIIILSPLVCNAQDLKPEILTNKRVVELVQAKFSAEFIIKKIQTADSVNFDTGTDELIKLKNSGVEEKIINAMLDRAASNLPARGSNIIDGTNIQEKANKFSLKKKFFTFDLTGCKSVGDTITCEFMVANNDKNKDREIIYPYGSTPTMIDGKGNRIKSTIKKIAGHGEGRQKIKEGAPVNGSVTFEGLKDPPKTIKLLILPFDTVTDAPGTGWDVYRVDHFEVEFRDVPVTQ
jgi:hypothetical protein